MVRKDLIFTCRSLSNRNETIDYIAAAADKAGLLIDAEKFKAAVYRREAEVSTSIGYGIAIPHGKTDAVKEAFIAFLSPQQPFIWEETLNDEIKGVFMIGVPASGTEMLHLKAISAISKKLLDDNFRTALLNAKTDEDAFNLLSDIDKSIK